VNDIRITEPEDGERERPGAYDSPGAVIHPVAPHAKQINRIERKLDWLHRWMLLYGLPNPSMIEAWPGDLPPATPKETA
jgi:hypothetical protein